MSIWIACQKRAREADIVPGRNYHSRRRRRSAYAAAEGALQSRRVRGHEPRVPMHEVVRTGIVRAWPSVAWRKVLQHLDPRPPRRAERGDPQPRADDVVQSLLLRSPVFALSGDHEAKRVAVAPQAASRVTNNDRRVIDTEKERVRASPFRRPFAWRKPQ